METILFFLNGQKASSYLILQVKFIVLFFPKSVFVVGIIWLRNPLFMTFNFPIKNCAKVERQVFLRFQRCCIKPASRNEVNERFLYGTLHRHNLDDY